MFDYEKLKLSRFQNAYFLNKVLLRENGIRPISWDFIFKVEEKAGAELITPN